MIFVFSFLFIYSNAKFSLIVIIFVFSSQSQAHENQPCNEFMAYALAHKGKATAPDVTYSSTDGPEAYTNASVHNKLTEYTSAARQRHGEDFDPTTESLDTDIIMTLGGGEAARPVLDGGQHNQLHLRSQPCPDSSKQHELLPPHTTSAAELTAADGGNAGYSFYSSFVSFTRIPCLFLV
jgi:hypothetical protein